MDIKWVSISYKLNFYLRKWKEEELISEIRENKATIIATASISVNKILILTTLITVK